MELVCLKGCLAAKGRAVEECVDDGLIRALGLQEYMAARTARDGSPEHHLTVLTGHEAKACGLSMDDLINRANETCWPDEGFSQLGIGSATQDASAKAWFVVVVWPQAAALREQLGLPRKDFHITVALRGADVHGVDKGPASLVHGQPELAPAAAAAMLGKAAATRRSLDKLAILDGACARSSGQARAKALLARAACHGARGAMLQAFSDAQEAAALNETPRAMLILGDCSLRTDRTSAVAAYRRGLELCKGVQFIKVRDNLLKRLERTLQSVPAPQAKFPRTAHGVDLGAATRDDLHLADRDVAVFCSEELTVTVEEKLDGANLGIWLDESWRPVCKNRSHFVCEGTATQWSGLDSWLEQFATTLCRVLGQRYAIYGEWMFAKHSIHYTALPSVFVAFDVYDRIAERFLSVASRDRVLRGSGIPIAATVRVGAFEPATFKERLRELAEATPSRFYSGPVEGVVARADEPGGGQEGDPITFQIWRCKAVRGEFTQAIDEHWTRGALVRNTVRADLFASSVADQQAKYPSTPHLPFSPCVQDDDVLLGSDGAASDLFCGRRVIVTEKMDGGNCCLKGGKVFGRTHAREASHWSFGAVKTLYAGWLAMHPQLQGLELFGESMAATHSILYDALCSPFYLFAARDAQTGAWLAWDDVVALAERLRVPTVPLVFDGVFANLDQLKQLLQAEAAATSRASTELPGEGFVVRVAEGFAPDAFEMSIAKYVRANHVQTGANWKASCAKAPILFSYEEGLARMRPPVSARPLQVFVDLDGTLADFDLRVQEITGKRPEELAGAALWRSIEGSKDFFTTLQWMPGAEQMWQRLALLEPTILSGVPMSSTRWAEKQKLAWCAQHLGEHVPVILCATRDKHKHSGPGRVLIDDRARTGRSWEEQGGIFIHHKNPADTLREIEALLSAQQGGGTAEGATSAREKVPNGAPSEAALQPVPAPQAASLGATGPKAVAESQRPRKLRLPKFRLIVLMGLPGSGKSTLADQLCERTDCVRVCQDELGSRDACEDLVGRAIKKHAVVVDRCNVTREERERWRALAMVNPKDAAIVHVDLAPDECVRRAASRPNHPTIKSNDEASIRRIVGSFAKRQQNPNAKLEGFARVFTAKSVEDVDNILAALV